MLRESLPTCVHNYDYIANVLRQLVVCASLAILYNIFKFVPKNVRTDVIIISNNVCNVGTSAFKGRKRFFHYLKQKRKFHVFQEVKQIGLCIVK